MKTSDSRTPSSNSMTESFPPYINRNILDAIIHAALEEDIGTGDVTTDLTVDESLRWRGKFIARAKGTIAGLEIFQRTFQLLDSSVLMDLMVNDGQKVEAGTLLAAVEGNARALLKGERVALNFLQRMSGIATLTRHFVEAVSGTDTVILDTRKTAPGLRLLDKWAVRLGGGENHRIGLFDMIVIKENHIMAAGGVRPAMEKVRRQLTRPIPVEIEVQNLTELEEALTTRPDCILLDNMSVEEIREAVRKVNGRIRLEASGNISLKNVREIAKTGVHCISIGKLTHSVRALDVSFLLDGMP